MSGQPIFLTPDMREAITAAVEALGGERAASRACGISRLTIRAWMGKARPDQPSPAWTASRERVEKLADAAATQPKPRHRGLAKILRKGP